MSENIQRAEYDAQVKNIDEKMGETNRIVKELHDQVYDLAQNISKLPLQIKAELIDAIDEKYAKKENFELVQNIVFGSIKGIIAAFFTIVFGVLMYALLKGWIAF